MPWTQSAIEASLWSYFVSVQQWLVESIVMTAVFKAAVATWIGILLMKALFKTSVSEQGFHPMAGFIMSLVISSIGFALLKSKSSEPFVPLNAAGSSWTSSPKVRNSNKYAPLNSGSANGLSFYVQIHRGVNQASQMISGKIGELFGDQNYNKSPHLLFETLAKTASATIDDPKLVTHMQWLKENCGDSRSAPVLDQNSSYSALYDLSKPDCADRYNVFKRDLSDWSSGKWGTSWFNVGDIGVTAVREKFGGVDEATLKNKLIASALVNEASKDMGMDNQQNVHAGALLSNADAEIYDVRQKSTAMMVGAANLLSLGGALNYLLKPLTGDDYAMADSRNDMAYLYNKIIQFLPPVRGYAKGFLAITFVFAAAVMCFGSARFMISWFGMLLVFTIYEPLSSLLYHSTLLFANAQETVDAFGALKNDPLALAGAAIIDANMARIQAVYFALQGALTVTCAGAGLAIFAFTKKLGSGLSDGLVGRAYSVARNASFVSSVTRAGSAQPKGGAQSQKT